MVCREVWVSPLRGLREGSVRRELTLCCFDMGIVKVKRSGVRGVDIKLPASLELPSTTEGCLRLLGVRRRKPVTDEVNERLDEMEGVWEPLGTISDVRRWCTDESTWYEFVGKCLWGHKATTHLEIRCDCGLVLLSLRPVQLGLLWGL